MGIRGLDLLAEDRLDCHLDGDQERLQSGWGSGGWTYLLKTDLTVILMWIRGLELLAEDRLDCHLDGDQGVGLTC